MKLRVCCSREDVKNGFPREQLSENSLTLAHAKPVATTASKLIIYDKQNQKFIITQHKMMRHILLIVTLQFWCLSAASWCHQPSFKRVDYSGAQWLENLVFLCFADSSCLRLQHIKAALVTQTCTNVCSQHPEDSF